MAATANDRTALAGSHDPLVQPSSYLRPRDPSHPMSAASAQSERAIDREERQGLVSLFFWFCCRIVFIRHLRETERGAGLESSGIDCPCLLRFSHLFCWPVASFCMVAFFRTCHTVQCVNSVADSPWLSCSVPFAISSKSATVTMSCRSVSV